MAMSTVSKPSSVQQSQRRTTFPNSVPANPSDVQTLIRQTGQQNPARAAIGVPSTCACRHGFPQAFAMDPLHAGRMNSGLLKLTCPHLVRAIDSLEDDGMIHEVNKRILDESIDDSTGGGTLQTSMMDAHKRHATARKQIIGEQDQDAIRSKLGEKGMQAFLEAGVAGSTVGSLDSKCMHAWMADGLFEGPTPLGDMIRQELENQNIDVSGTPTCHALCDPSCTPSMANPPKPRNKQRLRNKKKIERRKRQKQEHQD